MEFYRLKLCGLRRELPIVSLGPKLKIASFNLLGDSELVEAVARELVKKLERLDFDFLVGPEVKVVPLLHELTKKLNRKFYIVCRKQIYGYMVSPVSSHTKPGLVINGPDAQLIKGKRVVLIDDVVSTGRTMKVLELLMEEVGAKVVARITILKQGSRSEEAVRDLVFLGRLPLFRKNP